MSSSKPSAPAPSAFDVEALRAQFPVLRRTVHGKPLVYLDSAATTQKPQAVLDAELEYYTEHNANVHRGVHQLANEATELFEGARAKVAAFLGASPAECIFTRGTTEALNLVAHSLGSSVLGPGDRVLVTTMEHHSNLVPWQLACERAGAKLEAVPLDERGALDLDRYRGLLDERVKIVSATWISNALGTVNPLAEMIADARTRCPAAFVVDAAQAAPHRAIDVAALGCDFLAFSGHKTYAPMGIGVLYGKAERLAELPPYQGGGEMITSVRIEGSAYADPPHRFEAGTPNVAGAVGLAAAIDWLSTLDLPAARRHEEELLAYGLEKLAQVQGLRILGSPPERTAILPFVVDGAHPYDLAQILDREGVAIRTGHHCAEPLHEHLGVHSSARASLALYNRREDVDVLVRGVERARRMLA